MDSIIEEYLQSQNAQESLARKSCELLMIGVSSAYEKSNIAWSLIELARFHMISLGYDRALGVATSPITVHLAKQLNLGGHHHYIEKKYADFTFNGITPFKDIDKKMPDNLRWDGEPTYGLLVFDYSIPLRENAGQKIDSEYQELLADIKSKKRMMLGKPGNMAFNFSALTDVLEVLMNNSGDPFAPSSHRLSTKVYERKVIHFFAQQYGLVEENTFGYITSGGTEALEYGLLKGIRQFPDAVIIISEESHYSARTIIDKYQKDYRVVTSSSNGEIDYKNFMQVISGITKPVIVLANIGSTMKGAIDSVDKIKHILQDRLHYIHADAALHGSFLPLLPSSYGAPQLTIGKNIDSLSISLHKFLGNITPAGLVLTLKQDNNSVTSQKFIDYISSENSTLTCSRSGLAAVLAAYRLDVLGAGGLAEQGKRCVAFAHYLTTKLQQLDINANVNIASNIVYFPAPSETVCTKWMLPVTQGFSHVVVMPHADLKLLDEFLEDIVKDI